MLVCLLKSSCSFHLLYTFFAVLIIHARPSAVVLDAVCHVRRCLVPLSWYVLLPTFGTASEYVGSHQRLLQTSEHSQQRVKTGQELPQECRLLIAPCR